jgi:hypothetical protein
MKLLPFVLKQKQNSNGFTVTGLSLFLTHAGRGIWKTEESGPVSWDTIRDDYCEPNGLYVLSVVMDSDIAYIHVDQDKTNFSDFYTWEEALVHPSKPECWRRFYWFQDKEGAFWWSSQGIVEAELPELGPIDSLGKKILSFHT